jgi:PIN domain nuclease of toxin-antitoxin system
LILLDTQVVLWLAMEPERISSAAENAVNAAHHEGAPLAICGITLLEIATLARKRRITVDANAFLSEISDRFAVLPISPSACVHTLSLPASFPNDPADRIIVGTALAEGAPLITADREIRKSRAVQTIW